MGTSTHHKMPTGGGWTNFKYDLTSLVNNPRPNNQEKVNRILNEFSQVTFQGSASVIKPPAINSITKLASLVSQLSINGIDPTLRSLGLEKLIGHSTSEISIALINYICEDSNTIYDVCAKQAMYQTFNDLLSEAENPLDVENTLLNKLNIVELGNLLFSFLGNYFYEIFCNYTYERLILKVGQEATELNLGNIKSCIFALLKDQTIDYDITKIDWKGPKGKEILESIFDKIIKIFGE